MHRAAFSTNLIGQDFPHHCAVEYSQRFLVRRDYIQKVGFCGARDGRAGFAIVNRETHTLIFDAHAAQRRNLLARSALRPGQNSGSRAADLHLLVVPLRSMQPDETQGVDANPCLQVLAAPPADDRDKKSGMPRQTFQQPLGALRHAHFPRPAPQLHQRAVEIQQQRASLRVAQPVCDFTPRAKQIARRMNGGIALRHGRNAVGARKFYRALLLGPDLRCVFGRGLRFVHLVWPSSAWGSSMRISESSVIRLPAHANTLWRITVLRISFMRV